MVVENGYGIVSPSLLTGPGPYLRKAFLKCVNPKAFKRPEFYARIVRRDPRETEADWFSLWRSKMLENDESLFPLWESLHGNRLPQFALAPTGRSQGTPLPRLQKMANRILTRFEPEIRANPRSMLNRLHVLQLVDPELANEIARIMAEKKLIMLR